MNVISRLLVPIKLQALSLNNKTRTTAPFHRWQMYYNRLRDLESPDPAPFNDYDISFGSTEGKDCNNGVYIHWSLPYALRHGKQLSETGEIDFPLVPNRWLIVRFINNGKNVESSVWVVESDKIDKNGAAHYLDPVTNRAVRMGVQTLVTLESGWSETKTDPMFLKAVAPGNLTFLAYEPAAQNVFAFHDQLEGIEQANISYMVAGWYSDLKEDPLAKWIEEAEYEKILEDFGWVSSSDKKFKAILCHGFINSIQWQPEGGVQSSIPSADDCEVAVANSSTEALSIMMESKFADLNVPSNVSEFLDAMQFRCLTTLDEPGGFQKVQKNIHQASFQSGNIGPVFQIADKRNNDKPLPIENKDMREIKILLAKINKTQADYNKKYRELLSFQYELYSLWWKKKIADNSFEYPEGFSEDLAKQAFDDTQPNSLISRVYNAANDLREIQKNIKYLKNILYQLISSMPLELQEILDSRFWMANDPVVLIKGVKRNSFFNEDDALHCRSVNDCLKAINLENLKEEKKQLTIEKIETALPKLI